MIRLLGKIPTEVVVACSGGVDSMAAVDFLCRGGRSVKLAFFHHGTDDSENAEQFLREYCKQNNLKLIVGKISRQIDGHESLEEFWRKERYAFLDSIDSTIITCHHLDDVLETWIFSSAHGAPKIIPYRRNKIIRPFLLNRKAELQRWAQRHAVMFVNDSSNNDIRRTRNYIRHKVIPVYIGINGGVYKVMRKKVLDDFKKTTGLSE